MGPSRGVLSLRNDLTRIRRRNEKMLYGCYAALTIAFVVCVIVINMTSDMAIITAVFGADGTLVAAVVWQIRSAYREVNLADYLPVLSRDPDEFDISRISEALMGFYFRPDEK